MYLFSFVYVLSLVYFLFRQRGFDLNFVASIGFFAYFFPLFFLEYTSQSLQLYSSIILVMFLFYVFIFDYCNRGVPVKLDEALNIDASQLMLSIKILSLLFFILLVSDLGYSGLIASKTERSMNIHSYSIFVALVSLGFVYSVYFKITKSIYVFSGFLFLLLLSGTRTHIVMCMLSLVVILQCRRNGSSGAVFISFIKPVLLIPIVLFGMIGLFGKDFYASFSVSAQTGQPFLGVFFERVEGGFLQSLKKTEPFHTFSLFKVIIDDSFRVPMDYIFDLPLHFLPITTPFTDSLHEFSNIVKDRYYRTWSSSAGIGGNFWAEGAALFGALGVFSFMILYLVVLHMFNIAISRASIMVKPLLVLCAVYWGFYIQRNSLFQIISHEKRIFYIFVLVLIFSAILRFFYTRNKVC